MHSASKYCRIPILGAQEVYNCLKSHITKPEEFAVYLKMPDDIYGD